jgi:hypothetical protein
MNIIINADYVFAIMPEILDIVHHSSLNAGIKFVSVL